MGILIAIHLLQNAKEACGVSLPGVLCYMGAGQSFHVSASNVMHQAQPFEPCNCVPCSVAVIALPEKLKLTKMKTELVALQYHWANLVRFYHQRGCSPSWVDPDLPVILGIDCLTPLSPTPALWTLLEEPQKLKEPFLGFSSGIPSQPFPDHNYATCDV